MIAPIVFKQAIYAGTPLQNFNVGYDDASKDCQTYGATWCHNHEISNEFFTHSLAYQNGYIKGVNLNTDYKDPYTDYGIYDTTGHYQVYPGSGNGGYYGYNSHKIVGNKAHSSDENIPHDSTLQSSDSESSFPRHCDKGNWPSCYGVGYNAGLDDGKKGHGNGNCSGRHSANFCSGYSNGWQDAHRTDNIKSNNDISSNSNNNNQGQASKQIQSNPNNNINNQTFNPKNNQEFKPTITIINNPSSTSGSASNTNTTSGAGASSGSNSGSASSAGHNK